MKKLAIALVVFFAFIPFASSAEFWGSKNSNKYHHPTCTWAQKISSHNLVVFDSPEDAKQAGYVPCKICKPPVAANNNINECPDNLYAQTGQQENIEKSGCCSWHGGVCGCVGNRVQCCDGTLSPSCMCGE